MTVFAIYLPSGSKFSDLNKPAGISIEATDSRGMRERKIIKTIQYS